MLTMHSPAHRLHEAPEEINRGQRVTPYENPARVEAVRMEFERRRLGTLEIAAQFGPEPVLAVHDAAFVDFLQSAHGQWRALGRCGAALPTAALGRSLRSDRLPDSLDGRLAYYCFDPSTAITEGTWTAARASVDIALSAAQAIATRRDHVVLGLCRPPGHHAARSTYGGYCYLNNAAAAAQYLRGCGATRVSILDVDYHHGNGTQDIFYDRADVQFISIHADPATDYPYFLGYADETGEGAGAGCNHNLPLPRGTDWSAWSTALESACNRIDSFGPDALVVSLGVDTFKDDPLASFLLGTDDYLRIGERIAALQRPTTYLLEGGYALDAIGANVANVLAGHVTGAVPPRFR